MSDFHDPMVAWPPTQADTDHAPHVRSGGALQVIGYIVVVHYWMALHVALWLGGLFGLLYAIVPPVALFAAMRALADFTAFSCAMAVAYAVLLACTWPGWMCARRRWSLRATPLLCAVALPVLLVWMPVLAGSIASCIAIERAIADANPQCHAVRGYLASLRDYAGGNEYAPSHAWAISGGRRFIWSYREMAFVADARPQPGGARCL